jgi:hypothetical protein
MTSYTIYCCLYHPYNILPVSEQHRQQEEIERTWVGNTRWSIWIVGLRRYDEDKRQLTTGVTEVLTDGAAF